MPLEQQSRQPEVPQPPVEPSPAVEPSPPVDSSPATAAAAAVPMAGVLPPTATVTQRSPFEVPPQKGIYEAAAAPPAGYGRGQWLPPPVPGPGMAFNEVFVGETEPRRVTSILKEEGSGTLQPKMHRNVSWADLETGASLHEVQEYEPSIACPSESDDGEDPWRDSRCSCCVM